MGEQEKVEYNPSPLEITARMGRDAFGTGVNLGFEAAKGLRWLTREIGKAAPIFLYSAIDVGSGPHFIPSAFPDNFPSRYPLREKIEKSLRTRLYGEGDYNFSENVFGKDTADKKGYYLAKTAGVLTGIASWALQFAVYKEAFDKYGTVALIPFIALNSLSLNREWVRHTRDKIRDEKEREMRLTVESTFS